MAKAKQTRGEGVKLRDETWLDRECTIAFAAKLVGKSVQFVTQLVTQGHLSLPYTPRRVVEALGHHYVEMVKRKSHKTVDDELKTERALGLRQAREIKAGELISFDAVEGWFDNYSGILRVMLAGLPARITQDLDERKRIEGMCDAFLADISKRFASDTVATRKNIETVRADGESDSTRVGKKKHRVPTNGRSSRSTRTRADALHHPH